jgi:hypothetical protein
VGKLKERLLSIDEELALIEQYDEDTWPPTVAARYEELTAKLRALDPPADYAFLSSGRAINCIFLDS